MIPEYSTVRVTALRSVPEGERLVIPSESHPCVGDEGAVVKNLSAGRVIVEKVLPDGTSAWLAEFEESELEVILRTQA